MNNNRKLIVYRCTSYIVWDDINHKNKKNINIYCIANILRMNFRMNFILEWKIWFSSKLISERSYFHNVNQICFPPDIRKSYCVYNKNSLVRCSQCNKYLYFSCFYDLYHSVQCISLQFSLQFYLCVHMWIATMTTIMIIINIP